MKLHTYILKSAYHALQDQRPDGSMPQGCNGPWNKPDTPVRTTAHWAMTFMHAFEMSQNDVFLQALKQSGKYLLSNPARPTGDFFVCRSQKGSKDTSNGLIGQAWAIQPLIRMGQEYQMSECLDVALEVLRNHPYDEKRHGWHNMDVGGEDRGHSWTINQQVWFAAMVQQISTLDDGLQDRFNDFIDYFPRTVQTVEPGLIMHRQTPENQSNPSRSWKKWFYRHREDQRLRELSDGYLSFILYAFSMIERHAQHGSLLHRTGYTALLKEMLLYGTERLGANQVAGNRYAWSYNPVGIELAIAIQEFPSLAPADANQDLWVREQFSRHALDNPPLMCKNTPDPITLSARIYEAAPLTDCEIA